MKTDSKDACLYEKLNISPDPWKYCWSGIWGLSPAPCYWML